MCDGGGGGSSATTEALQKRQIQEMNEDKARQAQEEAKRSQAINAINALYGYQPNENDANAAYANYYTTLNAMPNAPTGGNYSAYTKDPTGLGFFTLGQGYDTSNVSNEKLAQIQQEVTKEYMNGKPLYGGYAYSKYGTAPLSSDRQSAINTEVKKRVAQEAYNLRLADWNNGLNNYVNGQQTSYGDYKANADSRQAGYDLVRQNSLNYAQNDISQNKADAERTVKFGLARKGLTGGSVDIDQQSNLADAYSKSMIQANQLADAQVAKLKSDDEGTRADLISRINAGLDADSAATTATQTMALNREQALSEPVSNSLNNLFSGIGNLWSGYQYGYGSTNPYATQNTGKSVSSVGNYSGSIS